MVDRKSTIEYWQGYKAREDGTPCPYEAGSPAKALWMEGLADCHDDMIVVELPDEEPIDA